MISFFLKIRNRKPWSLNIELKSGIFSIHFRLAIALSARITQNRLSTTRKSPRSTSAGWRRRTAAATTKVRRKVQERREKRMTTKMAGRANPAKKAKRSKIISRSDFKVGSDRNHHITESHLRYFYNLWNYSLLKKFVLTCGNNYLKVFSLSFPKRHFEIPQISHLIKQFFWLV